MTSPKKLDTIEVRDRFGTSEEILMKDAQESAQDRADAYGWTEISVKKSAQAPLQDGDTLRHIYEIYGVEDASQDKDASGRKSTPGEEPVFLSPKT